MLELRGYQQRTLEELESYLRYAQEHGASAAFGLPGPRRFYNEIEWAIADVRTQPPPLDAGACVGNPSP